MSLGDSWTRWRSRDGGERPVRAGQNGMALNGDGDVDVTWTPNRGFPLESRGGTATTSSTAREGRRRPGVPRAAGDTGGLGTTKSLAATLRTRSTRRRQRHRLLPQLNDFVDAGPATTPSRRARQRPARRRAGATTSTPASATTSSMRRRRADIDPRRPDTDTAWYDGAGSIRPDRRRERDRRPGTGTSAPPPPHRQGSASTARPRSPSSRACRRAHRDPGRRQRGDPLRETPWLVGRDDDEHGLRGGPRGDRRAEHLTLDQSAGLLAPGATGGRTRRDRGGRLARRRGRRADRHRQGRQRQRSPPA